MRWNRIGILVLMLPGWLYAATSESQELAGDSETASQAASDGEATDPRVDLAAVAQRALELEAREAALRELEAAVQEQITQLQQLQEVALTVLEPERAQREVELAKLVSFYQNMKPKSAAALLEKLPLDLATSVISRMKTREAGKILNVMNAARAVQISKKMADPDS